MASPAAKAGIGGGIGLIITAALGAVYVNEGDYADVKGDRGGRTMYGVTEAVMRDWGYAGHPRDFPKHCGAGAPVCADLVYTTGYIDRPGYRPMAAIEPAVLFELVDSAVLHGPARASGWFQGSLNGICGAGLKVDGKVGPATIAAYKSCQYRLGKVKLCIATLDAMDAGQLRLFDKIVLRDPSQVKFYRGWTRHRIGNVNRKQCLAQ